MSNDSSGTNPKYIQKSIQAAQRAILLASNSTVRNTDMMLIISPKVALAISQTDEVRLLLARSVYAKEFLDGSLGPYDIPPYLYGCKVVVEDTTYASNKPNKTRSADFVAGNYAVVAARPGGIESEFGTMSTISLGIFNDMRVTMTHDDHNEYTKGKVSNMFGIVPVYRSGYLIQSVLSS